jgi:radical SAM family uncharacterized protein/radical SAM-linked protein
VSGDIFFHPYFSFLHKTERPARYIGGEYGSIIKDSSKITLSMCLCFPDTYEIGMSHIGMRILYDMVNSIEDFSLERCYAPWIDMEKELRERNLPLISLETQKPLSEFDIVGFSLHYELTYTNVLLMLDLAKIPIFSKERNEKHPFVIAGGPCSLHPEPAAPFIDAFLIGDAENFLPEFFLKFSELKKNKISRKEMLLELSKIQGVYCPSIYDHHEEDCGFAVPVPSSDGIPCKVRRRIEFYLKDFSFPENFPLPWTEAVFDRVSIEIARGCVEGCRFCQAGYVYRPLRERKPDEILKSACSSAADLGLDEISIASLSTSDYSSLPALTKNLTDAVSDRKIAISFSSLRAYGVKDEVLKLVKSVRATGLTFAVEAGSQRLRDVINKNITEDKILGAAENAFSMGWDRFKLYFMIGLPTETEEDLSEIVNLSEKILKTCSTAQRKRKPSITVSVSTFVPKPHTPFQWEPIISEHEILRRQKIIKNLAHGKRFIELKFHDEKLSVLECMLSRGDMRIADAVFKSYSMGSRFDGWEEYHRPDNWNQAFRQAGVDKEKYTSRIDIQKHVPWDHIDAGVTKEFLLKELRRSEDGKILEPCLSVSRNDKIICYNCGVSCPEEFLDEKKSAIKEQGAPVDSDIKEDVLDIHQQNIYRIHYARSGRAAFLSHLDLMRAVTRNLRRTGLKLKYTEGFHPMPRISASKALPLGYRSIAEWIDVWMEQEIDTDELIRKLRAKAFSGIEFLNAVAYEKKNSQNPELENFAIVLRKSGEISQYEQKIDLFISAGSFQVSLKRKDLPVEIDIKTIINSISLNSDMLINKIISHEGFEDVRNNAVLQLEINRKEFQWIRAHDLASKIMEIEINPFDVIKW